MIERNWKIGSDFFIKYLVTDLLSRTGTWVISRRDWKHSRLFFLLKCQSKLAPTWIMTRSGRKLQIYFNSLSFLLKKSGKNARKILSQLHKFMRWKLLCVNNYEIIKNDLFSLKRTAFLQHFLRAREKQYLFAKWLSRLLHAWKNLKDFEAQNARANFCCTASKKSSQDFSLTPSKCC